MRPNYKMLKDDLKTFGLAVAEMKDNLGKVNYDKLSQSAKERVKKQRPTAKKEPLTSGKRTIPSVVQTTTG